MTDLEIAIELGKNVGTGKPLLCPLCSPDCMPGGQPMSSYGDDESNLFCPHCDLGINLMVFYNPNGA